MMISLKNIDFVVFDCDGVILDSNFLKSKAFGAAVKSYGKNSVERFLAYHKSNGGISRYKKFEYFFNDILKKKDPAQDIIDAINYYSEIVFSGLQTVSLISGVEDFIGCLKENSIPSYVNSGGDEIELREVFRLRGLDKGFDGIYGSPRDKKANLKKIIELQGGSNRAYFFGDSYSDYDAAVDFGLEFIYIRAASEWEQGAEFCAVRNILIFNDFKEVRTFLAE